MLQTPELQQTPRQNGNFNKKQTKRLVKLLNDTYKKIIEIDSKIKENKKNNIEDDTLTQANREIFLAFNEQAKILAMNGADPNVKAYNDLCWIYMAGCFCQDNVSSKKEYAELIEKYHLDVNAKMLGTPVMTKLFRADYLQSCDVLFYQGFDLNTPLQPNTKKRTIKGASTESEQNNSSTHLSKNERPFNFTEALYPETTKASIWQDSATEESLIEKSLIKKHVRSLTTIEQHLANMNSQGLKYFYKEKLKSINRNQFMKYQLQFMDLEKKYPELFSNIKIVPMLMDIKLLNAALTNKDPGSLTENEKLILKAYSIPEIKEVTDKIHQSKEVFNQIEISINVENDSEKIKQGAQAAIVILNQAYGTTLTMNDLEKEPLPDEIEENFHLYYEPAPADKLTLSAQHEIISDSKQMIMFSHKLGVEAEIVLENDKYHIKDLELSGFVILHTLPAVRSSLERFKQSDSYENVKKGKSEEEQKEHDKVMDIIIAAFKRAEKPNSDKHIVENWQETADAYKKGLPVLFESRWEGHSAMTVVYKDRMYICNKGAGTSETSIKCYKIGDPSSLLGEDAAKKFMELSSTVRKDKRILGELSGMLPGAARFSNQKMMEELKLTREKVHSLKGQKVGNCSYTNTKRGADAIMLALQDRQRIDKEEANNPHEGNPITWQNVLADMSKVDRSRIYNAFARFDRIDEVDKFFERLDEIGTEKLHTSHQSYLQPLLLVLRDKNNPNSKKHIEIGEKIVNGLRERGFTDEQIYKQMQKLPSKPLKDKLAMIAMRLLELRNRGLNQTTRENSRTQFWRALLPGGKRYESNQFLRTIGLDEKILKKSRWEQIGNIFRKEKKVAPSPIVTANATAKVEPTWMKGKVAPTSARNTDVKIAKKEVKEPERQPEPEPQRQLEPQQVEKPQASSRVKALAEFFEQQHQLSKQSEIAKKPRVDDDKPKNPKKHNPPILKG